MKKTALRTVGGVMLAWLAFASGHLHAQTQSEMNQEASREFQKADTRLNKAYQELLASDLSAEDKEQLKSAQRLWVQFRDAEAKFEAELNARAGTMMPLVYENRRQEITEARTEDLKRIRKGSNE